MKKIFIILLLLLGTSISAEYYSQTGGRKKERRAKKRGTFILTQYKSRGHADDFAKGSSGRRGVFARLFKKKQPSWVYKSSGSKKSHFRANQYLFTRNRTKGKLENASFQEKQSAGRSKSRVKGNRSFKFRKHKNR